MRKLERKSQPLISRSQFARRLAVYFTFGTGFLCVSLFVGTVGYAHFANLHQLTHS